VESLEVPTVLGQHLRHAAVTRFGERRGLLGPRDLERKDVAKRAGHRRHTVEALVNSRCRSITEYPTLPAPARQVASVRCGSWPRSAVS
jgi:hypothetical protein